MFSRMMLSFVAVLTLFSAGCQLILVPEEKPATRLELVTWGTNRGDMATAIALNPSGHIFITGTTLAGMDGQPYLGMHDAFLTHLDADGVFQGTVQWGTAESDIASGIAADGGGNVYVVGYTTGTLSGQSAAGLEDAFIVKFQDNGSQAWIRQFGTAGKDIAFSAAIDNLGNSYVVGFVSGSLYGQTHAGGEDAFLVKYDKNGNRLWTQQWGGMALVQAIRFLQRKCCDGCCC